MRKQLSWLFIMTVLVLTAAVIPTNAQSAPVLVARIPFNFVAKDRALPAGEYTIATVQFGASQALKLQSRDGHITVMVPARFAKNMSQRVEPKLLFNRYGDQYFLAQVLGFDNKDTHSLLKSRAEDELAKSASGPQRQRVNITGRHR